MSINIPVSNKQDAKYQVIGVIGTDLRQKGNRYAFKSGNLGYLIKNIETGNQKAITKDEALKNMIVAIQPYIDRGETPPAYYNNATIAIENDKEDDSKIKYSLIGTGRPLLTPLSAIDGNPRSAAAYCIGSPGLMDSRKDMFTAIKVGNIPSSESLMQLIRNALDKPKAPKNNEKMPTISHLLSEISRKFEDDRKIIDDIDIVEI